MKASADSESCEGAVSGLFNKDTNPIHESRADLINSQSPQHLISSFWKLGFQFGEVTNNQNIALSFIIYQTEDKSATSEKILPYNYTEYTQKRT